MGSECKNKMKSPTRTWGLVLTALVPLVAGLPSLAQDRSAPMDNGVASDRELDSDASGPSGRIGSDRAVVVHAGGAVVLTTPASWDVREIPYRREIRLAVGPDLPASPSWPLDGIWLAHHYRSSVSGELAELTSFTRTRLQSIMRGRATTLGSPGEVSVAGHAAVRLDFGASTPTARTRGSFWVFVAPWGHCEVCAMTDDERWSELAEEFERIVSSLQLQPPQINTGLAASEVHDAESILGSWKSYRGLLRLSGDGRVSLLSDRPFSYTAADGSTQMGREIAGHFRARQDLLFIEWTDRSKLNFRWREQQNRLLLTDHNGRTTQLRRIIE